GDALAPDRLAAGVGEDLAADEAAGHRNDFHREGETAEDLDLLCRVDDTHELFRGLGDDLFPGERRAAALDQALLRIAFIGAIDVKRDRTGEVEVEDLDAVAAEPFSALVGAGDGALDAVLDAGEGIDEVRNGRTRAHPDNHSVFHELDGLLAGLALGLAHEPFPSRDSRVFHWEALTGITESRAPLRIRWKSSPNCSLRVRMVASGMGSRSLRTKPTSTSIQRGSSSVAFGSKYFDFLSNWVGSGYGVLATS